jgi:hypothetical protein
MKPASRYPTRTKHGTIKDVVLYAKMNNMGAPAVAKHFSVPVNSVYRACHRMGVRLKAVYVRKNSNTTIV